MEKDIGSLEISLEGVVDAVPSGVEEVLPLLLQPEKTDTAIATAQITARVFLNFIDFPP